MLGRVYYTTQQWPICLYNCSWSTTCNEETWTANWSKGRHFCVELLDGKRVARLDCGMIYGLDPPKISKIASHTISYLVHCCLLWEDLHCEIPCTYYFERNGFKVQMVWILWVTIVIVKMIHADILNSRQIVSSAQIGETEISLRSPITLSK